MSQGIENQTLSADECDGPSPKIIVKSAFVYPVKSCGAIALKHGESIALMASGPLMDRKWMVVDHKGVFRTQRNSDFRRLCLVQPRYDGTDKIFLSAPGMDHEVGLTIMDRGFSHDARNKPFEVWGNKVAGLVENEASEWMSEFMKIRCKVIRRIKRLIDKPGLPKNKEGTLADGSHILGISEASLEWFNQKLMELGHARVGMNRFRPNLVFGGSKPFEENHYAKLTFPKGAELSGVKPCGRCKTINVEQETAISHDHVLKVLIDVRANDGLPILGENFMAEHPGDIRVGSRLTVSQWRAEGWEREFAR